MWVSYSDLGRDLRPGDRVCIVDKWRPNKEGVFWQSPAGDMDCWLGQSMTVALVSDGWIRDEVTMVEDDGVWTWFPEMFDSVYIPDATPLDDISSWQNLSLCSLFD